MNYLRLTLARKRRFVLNFTTSPLVEGSADDLHITVHLATETGGAASVQTAVRFEIAGYDDPPSITTGRYVEASSARGWEVLAGTEGDGAYAVAVRPKRGWVAGRREARLRALRHVCVLSLVHRVLRGARRFQKWCRVLV